MLMPTMAVGGSVLSLFFFLHQVLHVSVFSFLLAQVLMVPLLFPSFEMEETFHANGFWFLSLAHSFFFTIRIWSLLYDLGSLNLVQHCQ